MLALLGFRWDRGGLDLSWPKPLVELGLGWRDSAVWGQQLTLSGFYEQMMGQRSLWGNPVHPHETQAIVWVEPLSMVAQPPIGVLVRQGLD